MTNILIVLNFDHYINVNLFAHLQKRFPEYQFNFLVFSLTDPSRISADLASRTITIENDTALQEAIRRADQVWFDFSESLPEPDLNYLAIYLAANALSKPVHLIQNLDTFVFAPENKFAEWSGTQPSWSPNVVRLMIKQTSLIARQQKELKLRKLQLHNILRQTAMVRPVSLPFMTRMHRWRLRFIHEETRLEVLYYRVRDSIYKVVKFVFSRPYHRQRVAQIQNSFKIPEWWSHNQENDPFYDLLDLFWLEHASANNHTMILSAVPITQDDHRSAQLAYQLRERNSIVVYAYYRFDPISEFNQIGQVIDDGIFLIPIDLVWANPQRVFGSDFSPKGRPSLFLEFPHPLMFRIVNLANQMGWVTIYNAQEDWQVLKAKGMADWYDSAFDTYLRSNVRYKIYDIGGIEPVTAVRPTDKKEPLAASIVPNWWKGRPVDRDLLRNLDIFNQYYKDALGCIVLFSGVVFTRSEGQRATWLARAFSHLNIPVVFAYFRFSDTEKQSQDPNSPYVYQVPIDQLWAHPVDYINILNRFGNQRIFLAEFPHPALFRLINLFRANKWKTIYEAIDDWGEFKRTGQASWYDPSIESYILANADCLTATAEALVQSTQQRSKRSVLLLPNALEEGSLAPSQHPQKLPRGKLTIGYFGHLTSSWFDWSLVIKTAQRHPDWYFHIIGYGNNNNIPLPSNILLLGKVAHEELPYYAANWNVAMIPFKTTKLSTGVNPIKVYEYLQLHLPVVACGMPHLKKMPYVLNAQTIEEFETCVIAADQTKIELDILNKFLEQNTWVHRANQLLNMPPYSKG